MSNAIDTMGVPQYPVRFDVEYPEQLNRWLPLIKWLLVIPHLLILWALGAVASIIIFIAFFAILFTRKFPQGLFEFVANFFRWSLNVYVYSSLMRDEYPPFSWEPGQYPQVKFEVDYPQELNRWLPLIKWLLIIPHFLVLVVLGIAAAVVWIIAFFAILFTRRYPRGMFDFVAGVWRWTYRVYAYYYLMRDEYPPFSLK
jgi:urea transporter